jgi:multicomponent Na+:H+ antiporter subunit E
LALRQNTPGADDERTGGASLPSRGESAVLPPHPSKSVGIGCRLSPTPVVPYIVGRLNDDSGAARDGHPERIRSAEAARRAAAAKGNSRLISALGIAAALAAVWWLWSGHTDPFLLGLGALSCLSVVGLCWRMGILDDETVPLGLRPLRLLRYSVWLIREIVLSNLDVTRRILTRELPIRPVVIRVRSRQKSDLGRVIFANSITLTPGTVTISLDGDELTVHALSIAEADHDREIAVDMNRRVLELERTS